jgi:hypothetical protein
LKFYFEAAVDAANQWISTDKIFSIQIEMVILPNVDFANDSGTRDSEIEIAGGIASWFQFLRIWFWSYKL